MGELVVTSILWAFSFGLIAHHLSHVDPTFVAAARLALALAVMLPFLRPSRVSRGVAVRLMAIGAVQYGLMYLLYIHSYRELKAGWLVAAFTALVPLHVVAVEALLARRIEARAVVGAALAVTGAALLRTGELPAGALVRGFLLVQGANLCFAAGQVAYRRLHAARALDPPAVFAFAYLGGVAVAAAALALGPSPPLAGARSLGGGGAALATLLHLGVVASGLGFLLWNVGATKTGVGTLAVMGNLKAPLAVVVSLVIFGERADLTRLALGGVLIGGGLALTLAPPLRGQPPIDP